MRYILYKKKYINGKKRRLYKKEGSNKLYLKHKGRMLNIVKYKKYMKKKKIKQKKTGGVPGVFSRPLGTSFSIATNRMGKIGPNLKKQPLKSRVVEVAKNVNKYATKKIEQHHDKQRMLLNQQKQEQRRKDLASHERLNAQNKAERIAKHKAYMSRQHQGKNLHRQMADISSPRQRFLPRF